MKGRISWVMVLAFCFIFFFGTASCGNAMSTDSTEISTQVSVKNLIDLSDPLIWLPPSFEAFQGREPLRYEDEPENPIRYDKVVYQGESDTIARTEQDTYGPWLTKLTVKVSGSANSEVTVCNEMTLQKWQDGKWNTILESEEERAKYGFVGRYIQWQTVKTELSLEKGLVTYEQPFQEGEYRLILFTTARPIAAYFKIAEGT